MTLSEDIIFLSTYFKVTYDRLPSGSKLVGQELKRVENIAVPGHTETHIMNFVTLCKGRLFVNVDFESNMTGTVYIKKGEETVASQTLHNESSTDVPMTVEKGDTFSIYISNTDIIDTVATYVAVRGNYVTNGYAIGLVR